MFAFGSEAGFGRFGGFGKEFIELVLGEFVVLAESVLKGFVKDFFVGEASSSGFFCHFCEDFAGGLPVGLGETAEVGFIAQEGGLDVLFVDAGIADLFASGAGDVKLGDLFVGGLVKAFEGDAVVKAAVEEVVDGFVGGDIKEEVDEELSGLVVVEVADADRVLCPSSRIGLQVKEGDLGGELVDLDIAAVFGEAEAEEDIVDECALGVLEDLAEDFGGLGRGREKKSRASGGLSKSLHGIEGKVLADAEAVEDDSLLCEFVGHLQGGCGAGVGGMPVG